MPRVFFSCWSVTSAWPHHLRSGALRFLAPIIVRPPATTVTYFISRIFKHLTVSGSVSSSTCISSWQAGSLHYCVSSSTLNPRLHLTLYLQVIVYGIGLATYAWRLASKPKQLLTDEETGDVQPSLLSDPVTEPWDSSTRHLSELMSSLPSASVRDSRHDSRRESGRKSRLEKHPVF
jgi:hypothetical protein